jgi:SAM-dependent methyltransferase
MEKNSSASVIAFERSNMENGSEVKNRKEIFQHRESRLNIPHDFHSQVSFIVGGQTIIGSLLNVSTFGARIKVPSENCYFTINQKINIQMFLAGQRIFDGFASIVSEIVEGGTAIFGLSCQLGSIDIDQVKGILSELEVKPKIEASKTIFAISSKIRPEFKILVSDLNTLYQDLRSRLNEEEKHILKTSNDERHKARLEEHAVTLAIALYSCDFNEIFGKFQNLTDNFSAEEHSYHKKYFRANFSSLVNETPFMQRALEKPLGYAGDYGLMVMFYEYRDQGATLFDKFFHRFSCNQPAAVANKNRVELLSQLMHDMYASHNIEEEFKVSSLACGPARELQLFLEDVTSLNNKSKFKFIIADQEGLALDHATKKLKMISQKSCDLNLTVLKEDIVLGSIKERPFVQEFKDSHMIISAGLFDYLSDRVSQKLIEKMYEFLRPGGQLIIGNVSNSNPDRFSMDYFMEWNLILRSPEHLISIVPPEIKKISGATFEVISESLGLNLFLRIKKP